MSEQLDPVRRLRVLGAALPGVTVAEAVVDAPFPAVWAVAGDLVGGMPRFESTVSAVEVVRREGDRLEIAVRDPTGATTSWDVLLRPGLCWMQCRERGLLVGLAAAPEPGGGTRFAHAEGHRSGLARVAAPLLRWKIRGEIRKIGRLARADADAAGAGDDDDAGGAPR